MTDVAGSGAGIGVFGGTFDPIHIGHLRMALELKEHLRLDEMRLVPNADPYHRSNGATEAAHRLAMLQLAVSDERPGERGLVVDSRELSRSGPTYSVDTLQEIRAELGPQVPLYFCVGMDSLLNLPSWSRWQQLLDFAHVVVACRPGFELPLQGVVADWLAEHRVSRAEQPISISAIEQACGSVMICEMSLLSVSATELREKVRRGDSLRYLMPDAVIDYIEKYALYQEG